MTNFWILLALFLGTARGFDWDANDAYFEGIYACANIDHYESCLAANRFDPSRWRRVIPHVVNCLLEFQHSPNNFHGNFSSLFENGGIYQFGVFAGESMKELRSIFANSKMYGFDSFTGLPTIEEDGVEHWHTRQFNAEEKLKSPKNVIISDLTSALGGSDKVQFIEGYYNQSLKNLNTASFPPALYIDIDVDLYSSSMDVLDFIIDAGLMRPGTLVGYDDFWSPFCNAKLDGRNWTSLPTFHGEMKAHREIAAKHNIVFKCVGGSCKIPPEGSLAPLGIDRVDGSMHNTWGPLFVVADINSGDHDRFDAGMMKSSLEYFTWADIKNSRCAALRSKLLNSKAQTGQT